MPVVLIFYVDEIQPAFAFNFLLFDKAVIVRY